MSERGRKEGSREVSKAGKKGRKMENGRKREWNVSDRWKSIVRKNTSGGKEEGRM